MEFRVSSASWLRALGWRMQSVEGFGSSGSGYRSPESPEAQFLLGSAGGEGTDFDLQNDCMAHLSRVVLGSLD